MKKLQLTAAILSAAALTVSAQTTYLWTNLVAGSASGSWNNTANWDPAGPAAGMDNTAQFTLPLTNAATPGTITLDSSPTLGNLYFGNTSSSNLGWTINAGTPSTSVLNLSVSSGTPTISVTNRVVTFGAPIVSLQGFNLTGGGQVTFSTTNNFGTAANVVAAGILNLNNLNALPAGSEVSVSSGAALEVPVSGTYSSNAVTLAGGGAGGNNPGALWFRSGGTATTTWPGVITLNGNATISSYGVTYNTTLGGPIGGAGNLTLSAQGGSAASHTALFNLKNQSTYAGATVLANNGGLKTATWVWGTNNALPTTTALSVNNGNAATFSILDFAGYSQTLASLILNDTASTANEWLTNSSATIPTLALNTSAGTAFSVYAGTNNVNNLTLTVGGGGDAATTIGVGAATLLNVSNVTWNSSFYTALGRSATTVINLNSGTTLNNSGELLMGYGNGNAVSTLNVNTGAVVNAHYIRVGNNARSTLNLNAGATVTADEIYGYTTISNAVNWNGALVQPNTSPLLPWFGAGLTNIQILAGGANINTAGRDLVIAPALLAGSPSGGLTKFGAGTLILSNANNTYTGATVISNGTLAVDGSLVTSVVTNLAALAGTGYVATATLNAGSQLYPGRSNVVGTLTLGTLTSVGGSELFFDLSGSDPTPGSGINDLLALTSATFGSQTLVGLNFPGGYPYASNRYVLATYSTAAGLPNLALDPQLVGTRAAIALDTGTPGKIAVVLTNGTGPGTLTWYGNNPNNNWELTATLNWNSGADHFYTADNVIFDDSAQTGTVNLVGALAPGTVTFNNFATAYTLTGSGQISGATALSLNGTAPVVVDANNNNTGGVLLNGGNTLQIGNSDTTGAIGNGPVQFLNYASVLNYNRTDALTLNNQISGSSGVNPSVQVNSGTLTLAGATDNAYAAATVNSGGALVLAKTSSSSVHALGGGGTALIITSGSIAQLGGTGGDQIADSRDVQADGTFDLAGRSENINNLLGAGVVSNSAAGAGALGVGSSGASVAFNGVVVDGAGAAGLTKLGGGTLTVTTANTATGPLTIVGNGYVYLNNLSSPAWAGPVTFANMGTTPRLILDAAEQIGDTSVLSFGGNGIERRFQLNGFNETLGGLNDLAGVSGNRIVEAAADGVSSAPATLVLNVPAGVTNATGAFMRDAAGGAVGSLLTVIKTGPGTQTFSGIPGLVSYSGPTTVSNGVLNVSGANSVLANSVITLAGGTMAFSGGGILPTTFSGTGTLQVGGGTFIITNSPAYTGNTLISAGTLQLGDGNNNGSIPTDVTDNGTFTVKVATNTVQTYAGVISGTGGFIKDAFGTLYLNGANSFSGGATITAGALWINNSQSLGSGTKAVGLNNGTAGHPELHLNGTNGSILLPATIAFTTSWATTPVIQNEAGNNVINGNVNLTAGGGDTYITVNGGTLTLAGGLAPIATGRNLLLGGAASGTVTGTITNGTGANTLNSLRKLDSGTWTLSGINNFTGPTTTEAGTLLVNGALGTNTLTVFTNATLGGNGLILGAVTIQGGGTFAPGTVGLGTLTISNALTLSANSTNLFRLDAATTNSDAVAGLTSVTYGGTLIVTNLGGTLAPGQSFKLFNAATINPATFASVQLPALTGAAVWTNLLATSGTIAIVSTAAVATNAVPITLSVSGGMLNLSWPPDHLGWFLQTQTNTLAKGLGTNWVTVPGSDAVTNLPYPIVNTNGTVFFRLTYP